LPVGLEDLVKKTLAKDPQDRPPTARALRNALSAHARTVAPEMPVHATRHSERPLPLVSRSKRPTLELVRDSSIPPPAFPGGSAPRPPATRKNAKSPGVRVSPDSSRKPPPPPPKRRK